MFAHSTGRSFPIIRSIPAIPGFCRWLAAISGSATGSIGCSLDREVLTRVQRTRLRKKTVRQGTVADFADGGPASFSVWQRQGGRNERDGRQRIAGLIGERCTAAGVEPPASGIVVAGQ